MENIESEIISDNNNKIEKTLASLAINADFYIFFKNS